MSGFIKEIMNFMESSDHKCNNYNLVQTFHMTFTFMSN